MGGIISNSVLKIIAKVASGLGAGYLGVVGVLRFFEGNGNGQFYILACYFIIFAAMIVLAIIPVTLVTKYFSFLESYSGQGFFLVFVGLLLFNWNRGIEFGNSLYLIAAAALNLFVGFCT